jgi:hypothetical protein
MPLSISTVFQFLNVARDALQLNFGEIELQPLP